MHRIHVMSYFSHFVSHFRVTNVTLRPPFGPLCADIYSNKNKHKRHEIHKTNIGFERAAKAPPF